MTSVRLPPGTISAEELFEQHRRDDPEFAEWWERTAFAREVSHAVIRYRVDHGLDIDQLAAQLEVHPDEVGVLEDGEDAPDLQTLRLPAERLGLRFALDIHPGPSSGVEVIHSVA